MDFEQRIDEALGTPFEGWDFSIFRGRMTDDGGLPWDYGELVRERLPEATALLDLDTGGGELLASFAPLPPRTAATEGHPPNLPIARARLEPLGAEVAEHSRSFADGSFDLVLNRHGACDAREIGRLLAPGGVFVTQQVAGRDLEEVNAALDGPPHVDVDWDLATAAAALSGAGLEVTWRQEAVYITTFHDIGALVLFLRVVSWQVPGFTPEKYAGRLRALHEDMENGRPLRATARRFALRARAALA
ncbi:class I SAM-dependent methyltransferase [Nonomuraea solani]|nr:methyltransferase domain-containing protein [Nonomuraea solani]